MNRTQNLKLQIQKIQTSGKVAPEKTWISSYNVPKKSGKRYTYYRLMKKHPSGKGTKMVCYLGSKKSQAYKSMVSAIARRNQIKQLERELARLEQLERVSGSKKTNKNQAPNQNKAQLTSSERTIILQLQTQLNQLMKVLEELAARGT